MLRSLIVGCGNIAGGLDSYGQDVTHPRTHAGAISSISGVEIAACVEPCAMTGSEFSTRWGGFPVYPTIEDALNADSYDFIHICSPTTQHYSDLLASVSVQPKAIFCEKPIARTAEQSVEIFQHCTESRVPLIVNYSRRWDETLQDMAAQGVERSIGTLEAVVGFYTKGILNNGSHLIDTLMSILGPLNIVASTFSNKSSTSEDPDLDAILEADNGTKIHLVCTDSSSYSLFELQLLGSTAELCMRDGGLYWTQRNKEASSVFNGYSTLGSMQIMAGSYLPVMMTAIQSVVSGDALIDWHRQAKKAVDVQEFCELLIEKANHGL